MIGGMLPLLLICTVLVQPGPAAARHDKAFWQGIVKAEYAVPPNEQIGSLAQELSGLLASPDPELRDEFAYSILATWIFEKRLLDDRQVRGLTAEWTKNLEAGIGSTDTDDVLRRSFSALMLSVVVARDNATPFLEPAEVRALVTSSLAYLSRERDVRGYDDTKGWMHSAAHTADLLKFLARSRHLPPEAQREILDAIATKLRGAPVIFAYGEDQRFARAVLSVINRADFDRQAFDAWVQRAKPAWPKGQRPDAALVRANLNSSNLLAKLYVILSTLPQPGDGARAALDSVTPVAKTLF